jgi:hypothetical protein
MVSPFGPAMSPVFVPMKKPSSMAVAPISCW